MKITQEDIDSIINDVYAAGAEYNSTDESWEVTEHSVEVVEFLWKMYQELTENKGE